MFQLLSKNFKLIKFLSLLMLMIPIEPQIT